MDELQKNSPKDEKEIANEVIKEDSQLFIDGSPEQLNKDLNILRSESKTKTILTWPIDDDHIHIIGVFLAITSSFFKATSSSLTKISSLPAHMLALSSGILLLVVTFLITRYVKASVICKREDFWWLFIRCLGSIGFVASQFSVKFIPVTEATVIMLSSPFFGMVLARIFLSEPLGIYEGIMLIFTIAGVVTVIDPSAIVNDVGAHVTLSDHVIGSALSLVTAFTVAMRAVIFRKLRHIHFSVLNFWGGVAATFYAIILMVVFNDYILPTALSEIGICVASSVTYVSSNLLLTLATRLCHVGKVMIATTIEVIFAALYQLLLFQDPFTSTSIVGSLLVMFSIVLIHMKSKILKSQRT